MRNLAEVTVLESAETFLPKEDPDVSDEVYKILTAKRINILTGVSVDKIEDIDKEIVTVQYKNKDGYEEALEASAILVATGRNPMLEGLNIAAAGIKTNKKGYIEVNEFLKTNVPNIWAIGDINGGPQFTYISLDDFRLINCREEIIHLLNKESR